MAVPTTMQVVDITAFGSPDRLVIANRPVPSPGDQEVLIRVAAAGVNRADILQRSGLYPPPDGASDVLGLEVSGTVVECGSGVSAWQRGQTVCALVSGGGYAEYCVAPAAQCLPVPSGIELVDAAALPEACFTVWGNLFERGQLETGECVLIHGGASGVGTTAIQLAKEMGARVFATAGSDEKCRICARLGAERAVNYRAEDFVTVVRDATGGAGVHVVLDIVGGPYLRRNLDILAPDGRLVIIGLMGGAQSEIDLGRVMSRRLVITGSTLRSRPVGVKARLAGSLRQRVWPLYASGRLAPVVHGRFPMTEVAAAHRLMEASGHVGKILLVMPAETAVGGDATS